MKKDYSRPPLLGSIRDVLPNYDAFILDIWGVLHDGLQLFPKTLAALELLNTSGKQVLLLSNTPARGDEIAERLDSMGIGAALYDYIVTAGDSAHQALETYRGQACWYAGDEYAEGLLAGLDLTLTSGPDGARVMVNAMHALSGAEKERFLGQLRQAQGLGIPMICSNPDMVVHVGDRLLECPGTTALYYEEMGGEVSYHGKPHGPIYETAWELLGRPAKARMVAIGDSLHTDIQGANRFGIDSILNLGGIHRDEAEGLSWLESQPHRPTYLIETFR